MQLSIKSIFSSYDTGTGVFGDPRAFRCIGGEVVQLQALCDGFNNCTSGEDERTILCESKLYPDSPSESTWGLPGTFTDSVCQSRLITGVGAAPRAHTSGPTMAGRAGHTRIVRMRTCILLHATCMYIRTHTYMWARRLLPCLSLL